MRKLFLTWQDKESRKWFPIGQLTFDGEVYRFFYIKGAEQAKKECRFQGVISFPDFREVYESTELFPMFANRVMPSSRPEYKQTIKWLDLPENSDSLSFIARTGGAKVNDSFEMFCYPELNKNEDYNLNFFSHGLRYIPDCSIDRINNLEKGDKLYLAQDFQNPYDENALQLHTRDNHIVGYCPNYLLDDVNEVIRLKQRCEVLVENVNDNTSPLKFRLLCKMTFPKVKEYRPFAKKNYEPVLSIIGKNIESEKLVFA